MLPTFCLLSPKHLPTPGVWTRWHIGAASVYTISFWFFLFNSDGFCYRSICGISKDESRESKSGLEKVSRNEVAGFCIHAFNKDIETKLSMTKAALFHQSGFIQICCKKVGSSAGALASPPPCIPLCLPTSQKAGNFRFWLKQQLNGNDTYF